LSIATVKVSRASTENGIAQ